MTDSGALGNSVEAWHPSSECLSWQSALVEESNSLLEIWLA